MIQQNQSISSQIGAESLEVKKLNVHINSEIGSADVNIEADEPKEPERQNKRRLEQEGDNQRKDGEVPERQNKRRKEERDSPQKEGEGDRCQVEEKRQGTEQRIESHEYVLRVGQQMVGHQGFISFMKNAPNCKLHYCVENDQRIFTLQQTQQRGHSKLLNGPCMSCNKDHVIVGNLVNRDTILIDRGHTVAYLCAKARPFISVCPFSEQKCFNDHKSLSEEEFNYLFSLVDHICQGVYSSGRGKPERIEINQGACATQAHLHVQIIFSSIVWNQQVLPHFFDDNQRASFHRLRESRKPDINMNCKKVIVYDCLPKNTDGSYHTGNIKEIAYMLLDVCRKRLIASGESELPSFSSFSSASNGGFLLFFSSSRHAMRFVHSLYDYDLENPIRLPNGEPCFPTFNCLGK